LAGTLFVVAFPLVVIAAGLIGVVGPGQGATAAAASAPAGSGSRSNAVRHAVAVATVAAIIWAAC
jgi:L-aminopeptidase/D-esterase-like protein